MIKTTPALTILLILCCFLGCGEDNETPTSTAFADELERMEADIAIGITEEEYRQRLQELQFRYTQVKKEAGAAVNPHLQEAFEAYKQIPEVTAQIASHWDMENAISTSKLEAETLTDLLNRGTLGNGTATRIAELRELTEELERPYKELYPDMDPVEAVYAEIDRLVELREALYAKASELIHTANAN